MSFSENCTIELIECEVDSDGGVVENKQLVQVAKNSPKVLKKQKKNKIIRGYTNADIDNAIQAVKRGAGCRETARKFKIPITTLFFRSKGFRSQQHGKLPVLSRDLELKLAEWLMKCSDMGRPRSTADVLNAAGGLAGLSADKTNKFKDEKPTRDWVRRFRKRNPDVSLRKPQAVTRASAVVSPEDIVNFIKNLREYFEKHHLMHVFACPRQIGNLDETSFALNPATGMVYARRGAKNVSYVESAQPKINYTVTMTFLADGTAMEPQIIIPKSKPKLLSMATAGGGKITITSLKYQSLRSHSPF